MTKEKGQGFGFGLGKIKELQEAFQKAQQVQAGAQELQQQLQDMEIPGVCDGELVTVVMSGNQEPLRVEIKPEAMEKTAQDLSELVAEAMKDAYANSTDVMRSKMEELTNGLNLPGL
ncbi:MAG TPA: YbaB/EbfC family nucleoid-associated protein [Cyanothece sp. UBA12306]|nr:YbaB/EbfC family nucleoid-associated protein [Cyanothece sp. UBA12306]